MAQYSYNNIQVVATNNNVAFNNGDMCCTKGLITHSDGSGIFRIKGAANSCRPMYEIQFTSNIAIQSGTVQPISVALTQNGEIRNNAVATVTPLAVGSYNNVNINLQIEIPCGCCDTIAVRNISGVPIDAVNSNIIIKRIA